ncbi:hypothetical protein RRG08_064663 [Elysia crispata]|uniref:Ig-like domain-containing protein n=1 Tax=Elysia crispata TaxID=231223 RepID=A0AAE1BAY9_9GAST|nr:hypothetical protein RRG08_064663 [Elysia crispata]
MGKDMSSLKFVLPLLLLFCFVFETGFASSDLNLETTAGRRYVISPLATKYGNIAEKCKDFNMQPAVLASNAAFREWNDAMVRSLMREPLWFITEQVSGEYRWLEEKIDESLYNVTKFSHVIADCSKDQPFCHRSMWSSRDASFKLEITCCKLDFNFMCDKTDYCAANPCQNKLCHLGGGSYTCNLQTPSVNIEPKNVSAGMDVQLNCSVILPDGIDASAVADSFQWFLGENQLKDENMTGIADSPLTLEAVGLADRGFYSCRYVSGADISASSQMLELVVNPPNAPTLVSSATVIEGGGQVTMSCSFSDQFPATVMYLFLQPMMNTVSGEGRLDIHNINTSNRGEYKCKISISGIESGPSNSVWISLKPAIPKLSTSIDRISHNGEATLHCSNKDVEPPVRQFIFMKNDEVIQEGKDDLAIIKNFSPRKDAEYSCFVQIPNAQGTSDDPVQSTESNVIHLSYAWSAITLTSSSADLKDGDTVNLTCDSSEPKIEQYHFYKDSIPLDAANTFTTNTKYVIISQELKIQNFTAASQGEYTCKVLIGGILSPISNSINLILSEKPTLSSTSTTVPKGSTIKLSCSGQSDLFEIQSYSWAKDGQIFTTTSESRISLKPFTEAHEGNYSCRPNHMSTEEQQIWSDGLALTCVPQFHICNCYCSNQTVRVNVTYEEVQEVVGQLERDLKVQTKNLSASQRKKISVPDFNAYSTSVGFVAILINVLVFGSIMIADGHVLIVFACNKLFCRPKKLLT